MEYIDQDPNEGMATQQINKNYQSSQIVQANATGFGRIGRFHGTRYRP